LVSWFVVRGSPLTVDLNHIAGLLEQAIDGNRAIPADLVGIVTTPPRPPYWSAPPFLALSAPTNLRRLAARPGPAAGQKSQDMPRYPCCAAPIRPAAAVGKFMTQ
jgi:hypothetical protein